MFRTRFITAIILAPVAMALILYAPLSVIALVSAVLFLLSAWEWSGFLALDQRRLRATYVVVTGVCMLLAAGLWLYWRSPVLMVLLGVAWWAFVSGALAASRLPTDPVVGAVGGLLTLVPAWLALNLLLVELPERAMLVAVLFIIWGTDVGGYLFGKLFGRHPLAPSVSPRKTWEGVAGGVLLALLVAWVTAWSLERWAPEALPEPMLLLPLAAVTALISVQGDLLVSAFKRKAGLKDSGNLIPGHGGLLDRFDSMSAAMPVFLAGLWLIGA